MQQGAYSTGTGYPVQLAKHEDLLLVRSISKRGTSQVCYNKAKGQGRRRGGRRTDWAERECSELLRELLLLRSVLCAA
jgi:hypothetical protein